MYQSNFQKLLQANPSISKKAAPTASTPKTPKRTYEKVTETKFASMSKRLDTSKVEQLRQLSQLTSISESGIAAPVKATKRDYAATKILGDSGLRADRSAPAKSLYIPDLKTPQEKQEIQRQQFQHTKQIQKQETHIKNYIDNEWWYTNKNNIHVPPLHDPLVIVHHYALGPKHSTVFDMATVDTDMRDERDYQHVLVRIAIVTKYGQVIYDRLVQPIEKVIDYRTDITGISRSDFQIDYDRMKRLQDAKRPGKNIQTTTLFMNPKVSTLKEVCVKVAEIIENRVIVGFLLNSCAALNELEKQALLHKFSANSGKRNMTTAEQKELMDDYKAEDSVKGKNYLLDLLHISHPVYLTRDFSHGKIVKIEDFILNKFMMPSLSGFIYAQQQKHGLTASGASLLAKKRQPDTTKGGLTKDSFLSLSRPLGFVSLDILLNNAMATYQLYMILKGQWDDIVKHSHGLQLSQYRTKILDLSKAIEDQKELNAIAKDQEDAKQKRREAWDEKFPNNNTRSSSSDHCKDTTHSDDDSNSDSDSDTEDSRW